MSKHKAKSRKGQRNNNNARMAEIIIIITLTGCEVLNAGVNFFGDYKAVLAGNAHPKAGGR